MVQPRLSNPEEPGGSAILYGYARVSTQEQETHAQIDALEQAGVDQVFQEKRSGSDNRRPILESLLDTLQPGDVLVVYKLDRIARSLKHLLQILERVHDVGAEFRSLTEVIDTRSPAGRMMMQIIGAFAEFERELIRERTRVGMRAAMDRGTKVGRPRAMTADEEAECVLLWRGRGYTKSDLARRYGCHLSSVKRAIQRDELERERTEQGRQIRLLA